MTDKEQSALLEKFANEHALALNIKVVITEHSKELNAKDGVGANYNDCVLLSDLIRGAESLLYWLRNEGYIIKKGKK